MYRTLLEMAEKGILMSPPATAATFTKRKDIHPIFPLDRLPSTGVLPGHVWLKQALDSQVPACHLAEYLSPRIYPPAQVPFRARPTSSGYSVDHRSAAGG
jgi:hypothetical protein